MGARKAMLRLLFGEARAREINAARTTRRTMKLPDRAFLRWTYIPAFAAEGGKILWVGCRDYTPNCYGPLEINGGEVWTTDIDPEAELWGRAGRHRVGDICQAETLFPQAAFDAVICNGVFGWGVDSPAQQAEAAGALAGVLRPRGRLLLGWNRDRMPDPVALGVMAPFFSPAPFAAHPSRVEIGGATHVYDSFVRRESGGPGSGAVDQDHSLAP
ncbi:MAG: class I SAM-dependent methyltransferase [Caulobacteraceae bacterium]